MVDRYCLPGERLFTTSILGMDLCVSIAGFSAIWYYVGLSSQEIAFPVISFFSVLGLIFFIISILAMQKMVAGD